MINNEKTLEHFGYTIESLSKKSHKPVITSCDYCGIELHKRRYNLSEDMSEKICCKTCKTKKQHETIKKTGGMEDINKKRAETNIKKYGAISPCNNPEIMEKIKEKNREKYGVDFNAQREDVQKKIQETHMAKYGYKYPFESPEIKKRISETRRKNRAG